MSENPGETIKTLEYSYSAEDQISMYCASIRWRDYDFMILIMTVVVGFLLIPLSVGPLAILVPLLGVAYPFRRMELIRGQHRQEEARGPLPTQQHAFDGEFIATTLSTGAANRLKLADFQVAVTRDDLLYLYFDRYHYLAIPWRAFRGRDDIDRLYAQFKVIGLPVSQKHPKSSWQGLNS